MANNYTQFSTDIPATTEQQEWLIAKLESTEEGYPPCQYETEETGLWVFAEEYGDIERLAEIIAEFQTHFKREESIILTYAQWCSKMRLDEFGGGAVAIYKGSIEYVYPFDIAEKWIRQQKTQGV